MVSNPALLDSDFRYIDKNGKMLKTRTELSISQMLSFLGLSYEYQPKISLPNGKTVTVDFKTERGLIEHHSLFAHGFNTVTTRNH